uniref:Eukaryotic translation initiation factor 3 subunit B n=1 Tax=Parascaris univalens TaxID=6257 RepID=A0A915A0W3_PARUN
YEHKHIYMHLQSRVPTHFASVSINLQNVHKNYSVVIHSATASQVGFANIDFGPASTSGHFLFTVSQRSSEGQEGSEMHAVDLSNAENDDAEPSFSDREYGYTDSISDEELVGDVLRKKPQESVYELCCVIVCGIPVVGEDRLPKLKAVLGKLFARIHTQYKDNYPLESDGKTKGYCFLEYPNSEVAATAMAVLDGYILDKNHVFSTNTFADLHKSFDPDPQWKPPVPRPYTDFGDLWWWLQNDKCCDQFAVHYEREASKGCGGANPFVAVYEFNKGKEPQLASPNSERQNWTASVFQWSPLGTFLASIHHMGVALWAGRNFDRFVRFQHENVAMLDFSPLEKFVVTYAMPGNRWKEDTDSLRIFDVQTGEMRKGFSLMQYQRDNNILPNWPYFQWSFDDRYAACPKPGNNGISIYESEHFTLLNKKHIVIDNIRTFQWSPTRSLIAYYCEEKVANNAPAEFGLMEIPSKVKIRAQRIFSVSDAEMFWNKNGDRLAVHTERYQKKNIKSSGGVEDVKYSKVTSHIEIFDAREKEVSVLSLPLTEQYVSFGWEPKEGDKFCVLVSTKHKVTPLIYALDSSKHTPQLISKFEPGERFTAVAWAPNGGWLAVYSASASGAIMFIDSNGTQPTQMTLVEYPGFSKGYWDPTGRYFAAVYTIGGGKGGDTGYRIFTFQGKELFRKNLDRLVQFKWRPRLPVKLSDEKIKLIRRNFKTSFAKFEEEDKYERGRASQVHYVCCTAVYKSFHYFGKIYLRNSCHS